MLLVPGEPSYPASLYRLDFPPPVTVSGPLAAARTVAIVGSREAPEPALAFTFRLAYHLARANVVVISGGAVGVDRTAHEGAMSGGGATWLVSPTGRGRSFPVQNDDLVSRILGSDTSRMIWPFPDGTLKTDETPRFRNGVLVALAEHVVVIQAAARSGSRNAAHWGRRLERPVHVVPGAPWMFEFEGSVLEILRGAQPLWSITSFFEACGLPKPDLDDPALATLRPTPLRRGPTRRHVTPQRYSDPPSIPVDRSTWTPDELAVFSMLLDTPIQQDAIVSRAGLKTSATLTALLTLSLKDVVVEGPDGFFRRRIAL